LFCLYWQFVSGRSFVSHTVPKLMNFKHLKSISILLHNEIVEERRKAFVPRMFDGKGVYSQLNILFRFKHLHIVMSVHYLPCTECLWLDQEEQFIQEKIVNECDIAFEWYWAYVTAHSTLFIVKAGGMYAVIVSIYMSNCHRYTKFNKTILTIT